MRVPTVRTSRKGIDTNTGNAVDMSFDSNYKLQKIVKAIKRTSVGDISHGLLYPPQFHLMAQLATSTEESGFIDFNTVGTYYWICPVGVTQVTIKLWGGGGAGGGLNTNNTRCGGGGGAGGQYVEKVVNVTAGVKYKIVVADVKDGTVGNGSAGNDSGFYLASDNSVIALAKGGAGGQAYQNGGAGGTGSTTGGIGDIVRKGGNGLSGSTTRSGSGGGGAGEDGDGNNGTTTASSYTSALIKGGNGGTNNGGYGNPDDGLTGGAGGYGVTGTSVSSDGFSGFYYGGGGGGGYNHNASQTTDRLGGTGSQGRAYLEVTMTTTFPLAMGNIQSSPASVDSDYITVDPTGYDAIWAYVFLDPVDGNEPVGIPLNKLGYPFIRVGGQDGDLDHKRKMHSYYDSFKVKKTGSLEINLLAHTYNSGDAGTYNWVDQYGNNLIVEETEVSYNHGLGYCPMFAPFVNTVFIPEIYFSWNAQTNYKGLWANGVQYIVNEVVVHPDTGDTYTCIQSHVSATATNKPASGSSWASYWVIKYDSAPVWVTSTSYVVGDKVSTFDSSLWTEYTCIANHTSGSSSKPVTGADWWMYWDFYTAPAGDLNVNLNEIEDIKFRFGGVELFNATIVRFYATEQDLILNVKRLTYDFALLGDDNWELPATNVSVNYTIFGNRADNEFNLLN